MSIRPRLHPTPETPIRVLVAEDEVLLRSALPDLLNAVAPGAIEVVAQCGTREEAIRHTRSLQPDVVLLDLRMPDREGGPCTLGGAETVAALRRQSETTRIVCLTSYEDAAIVRSCLDAGAVGFLGKGILPEEIWEAVRTVLTGKVYVGAPLRAGTDLCAAASVDAVREQLLAGRRGDVLRLLLDGCSPAEIAAALPIGKKHVDKKIAEIKTILGVSTHIRIYQRCQLLGLVEKD